MSQRTDVPVYRPDIYSPQAILDPYPHYAKLRELGPVVWLANHKVYALPRYAECKAVLLDDKTFTSGDGVALNPVTNRLSRGTTLNSDSADHDRRRSLVAHRLTPRALRAMRESGEKQAAAVVDAALAQRSVDGVEVAAALPTAVVPTSSAGPNRAVNTSCAGARQFSTPSVLSTGAPSKPSRVDWA